MPRKNVLIQVKFWRSNWLELVHENRLALESKERMLTDRSSAVNGATSATSQVFGNTQERELRRLLPKNVRP
jgi:hypothetical protein